MKKTYRKTFAHKGQMLNYRKKMNENRDRFSSVTSYFNGTEYVIEYIYA